MSQLRMQTQVPGVRADMQQRLDPSVMADIKRVRKEDCVLLCFIYNRGIFIIFIIIVIIISVVIIIIVVVVVIIIIIIIIIII